MKRPFSPEEPFEVAHVGNMIVVTTQDGTVQALTPEAARSSGESLLKLSQTLLGEDPGAVYQKPWG